MDTTYYLLGIIITLSIGLHLCVATGQIGLMAAEARYALSMTKADGAVLSRSIGTACATAGFAFFVTPLTTVGVALIAASVLLSPRHVFMLPAPIDLPLLVLSVTGTGILGLVRGLV